MMRSLFVGRSVIWQDMRICIKHGSKQMGNVKYTKTFLCVLFVYFWLVPNTNPLVRWRIKLPLT